MHLTNTNDHEGRLLKAGKAPSERRSVQKSPTGLHFFFFVFAARLQQGAGIIPGFSSFAHVKAVHSFPQGSSPIPTHSEGRRSDRRLVTGRIVQTVTLLSHWKQFVGSWASVASRELDGSNDHADSLSFNGGEVYPLFLLCEVRRRSML